MQLLLLLLLQLIQLLRLKLLLLKDSILIGVVLDLEAVLQGEIWVKVGLTLSSSHTSHSPSHRGSRCTDITAIENTVRVAHGKHSIRVVHETSDGVAGGQHRSDVCHHDIVIIIFGKIVQDWRSFQ